MKILRVVENLPKHPSRVFDRRPLADITHIAIHHSATDAARTTVDGVAKYHTTDPPNGRGWAAIAYHFCIDGDGQIYETLDLDTVGAHVYGHNPETVGICVFGNFTNGTEPSDAQRRSLSELVAWLCSFLQIPPERVWGHRDFSGQNTVCPGDTWYEWGLPVISDARTLLENAPRMWSEEEVRRLIVEEVEKHGQKETDQGT